MTGLSAGVPEMAPMRVGLLRAVAHLGIEVVEIAVPDEPKIDEVRAAIERARVDFLFVTEDVLREGGEVTHIPGGAPLARDQPRDGAGDGNRGSRVAARSRRRGGRLKAERAKQGCRHPGRCTCRRRMFL